MSLGLQLAVPFVCSRCILAKCEFFNKVQVPLLCILSMDFVKIYNLIMNVLLPLLFHCARNILIISSKTRISGKLFFFISLIKSKKCEVSFNILGRFDAKGAQMFSISLDKFSIAGLRPVVNNLTSMSDLLVL